MAQSSAAGLGGTSPLGLSPGSSRQGNRATLVEKMRRRGFYLLGADGFDALRPFEHILDRLAVWSVRCRSSLQRGLAIERIDGRGEEAFWRA